MHSIFLYLEYILLLLSKKNYEINRLQKFNTYIRFECLNFQYTYIRSKQKQEIEGWTVFLMMKIKKEIQTSEISNKALGA